MPEPTMEDLYRQLQARGIDPATYEPGLPRLPTLRSTQAPPPPPPGPPPGIIERTPEVRQLEALREMSAALQRRQDRPYGLEGPQTMEEIIRAAQVPDIEQANPPEYLQWLAQQRAANDARFGGPQPPAAPLLPTGLPPGLPAGLPFPEGLPTSLPAEEETMGPEKALDLLETTRRTGAEAVAREAEDEADTEAPTRVPGSLATIEQPGDLARARAMQRLGQLTAMRGIAESVGQPIPVAGTFLAPGGRAPPFKAEGIREEIARTGTEEMLRMREQLRGETQAGLQERGAGFAMERLQQQEKMRIEAARVAREYGEQIAVRKTARDQLGKENLAKLNARLRGTAIKPLTDSSIGRLTAMEHLDRELTGILRDKHKFNTGPVINAVETTLSWILGEWAISPEKAGFRSRLNNVLAWYVRAVEGGRPSDRDREFLKTVAPHAGDDDQSLVRKAANLLNWAKRNKVSVEKLLKEGRTITGKSSILDGAIPFGDLTPEQQAEGWESPVPAGTKVRVGKGGEYKNVLENDLDYWSGEGWTRA